MDNWSSVTAMIEDLGLQVDSNDKKVIRDKILQEIINVHPDRFTGKEYPLEIKDRCIQLTRALECLDQWDDASQALISVNQIAEIVKVVMEANVNSNEAVRREERITREAREVNKAARRELSFKYQFPRITSGIFSGFFLAIYNYSNILFSAYPWQELKVLYPKLSNGDINFLYSFDQPQGVEYVKSELVKEIAANCEMYRFPLIACNINFIFFRFVVGALLFTSVILFLLTWFYERAEKAREEWLLSDAGREKLFEYVILRKFQEEKKTNEVRFAISDWVYELLVFDRSKPNQALQYQALVPVKVKETLLDRTKARLPFRYGGLSQAIAEKIAKLHIEELERLGFISRVEANKRKAITYRVQEDILTELKDDGILR